MDKSRAEVYKFGISAGLLDEQAVINWADNRIALGSEDEDIIEISSARDRNELVAVLSNVRGNPDYDIVFKECFGVIAEFSKNNPGDMRTIRESAFVLFSELRKHISNDQIDDIWNVQFIYEDYIDGQLYQGKLRNKVLEKTQSELGKFLIRSKYAMTTYSNNAEIE